MSLPSQLTNQFQRKASILLCLAGVLAALTACQVRPLYGSLNGQTGTSIVSTDLAATEIEPIDSQYANSDTVRVLYNELLYNFERGADRSIKRFRLEVLVDLNSAEVGVERLADVPSAYTTTLTASFVLSDIASNTTLYTGKSFATASYDFSNQRFANQRASKDAQERVARIVADDIQARLAGYFAEQSTGNS
ncbi:LPS-assembly lipoprotein [Roseibium hamelinense]|uniref:LPS-assembly lipoprotein n=1 Tax=Roseibium hamelinense TaxID=150831 RepID=A0A562SNA9_9HYPH|nr:hypothetical protein [Roseibium hamelinense]MTI43983.1 hypothetical protein [Roseibium hamelinense]TWI82811.1 LPS-assembly lipoprotein [Roseibium hamelinense]